MTLFTISSSSGISIKYLGEYLDIHFGAEDAVFPHHTNEIAQSEAYLGHKWCTCWVHLSWLLTNNIKMSKSLGHVVTIKTLKELGYNPLAFRYFILTSYYHKQVNFTYEILDQNQTAYLKLLNKISNIKAEGEVDKDLFKEYDDKFKNALENDFGTSNAITLLYDLIKDNKVNGTTKLELIKSWDTVLSLDLIKEETTNKELESYILDMINQRNEAKKNKDFAKADSIRDELLSKGIQLVDTREGTTYKEI